MTLLRTMTVGLVGALLAGCATAQPLVPMSAAAALVEAQSHKKAAPGNGSVKTENFSKVSTFLFRGGVPSDDDLAALSKLGVTTDVNLMGGGSSPTEHAEVAHERETAQKLGITFINLPVPFDVPFPRAMADTFLKTVEDEATRGGHVVYVHCVHGRDRTGTMVSYYRVEHDQWTVAKAMAEQESFGFKPAAFPTFTAFLQGLGQ